MNWENIQKAFGGNIATKLRDYIKQYTHFSRDEIKNICITTYEYDLSVSDQILVDLFGENQFQITVWLQGYNIIGDIKEEYA